MRGLLPTTQPLGESQKAGGDGPRSPPAGFLKPSRDNNKNELLEFPALSAWI